MIVLHHLKFSRSSRVIWLLEEIGSPYELIQYDRGADMRAPDSLKMIHPLGKAPILTDGSLVLAESSAVLRYLDETYGGGMMTPPRGSPEAAVHGDWLDYVEGSAALPIMFTLIGQVAGGLTEGLAGIASAELSRTLSHISDRLSARHFLMGDRLTLADIQMSYMVALAHQVGLLTDYPNILNYRDRLMQQPGLIKAIEKGGPLTLDFSSRT